MVSTDSPPEHAPAGSAWRAVRLAAWLIGAPLLVAFLAPGRMGVPASYRVLVSELAFLAPHVLAIAASAVASRCARDAERSFWTLLVCSFLLIMAVEVQYSVAHVIGAPMPAPSMAIVVPSVGAAGTFIALLVMMTRLRLQGALTRMRYGVDALLVGAITFVVTLTVFVEPLLAGHDLPASDKAIAATYPVLGLVVLGGTLTNLFGLKAERWRPWERFVVIGIATYALAVVAWPVWYMLALQKSPMADGIEALWSMSKHFIFVGAVYRLTSPAGRWDLKAARALPARLGSWGASVMLGVAAVVAGLAAHHTYAGPGGTLSPALVETIILALAGLLVLRTGLMAAENRSLRWSVTHDPVTGLPNHRRFHELLAGEVAVATRFGDLLAVAVMDIDSFGVVNDLMGHPEGDRLLQTVAATLRSEAPEGAVVCRIGGDEFGVVMPHCNASDAEEACHRMRDALAKILCPALPRLKASFGIAAHPAHATLKDELLRFAHGAAYWAKMHGKDMVVVYDPEVVEVLSPEDRIGLLQREHVLDTMQALAAAVDARDPGTRFHSRTVAAYAVMLAEDLGLEPDRVRLLEVAAILHDVGKIGVSDSVLLKAGPLTASERRHVQEHPLLADRILSSTALSEIVPWIVAHHERWDGNGYPYGIPGETIPLEARILAICDAYDAMISDRPYRSALSVEAALQEIDLNIGTQFDPDMAERFIRIVEAERMGRQEAAGA